MLRLFLESARIWCNGGLREEVVKVKGLALGAFVLSH